MLETLKEEVLQANLLLPKYGLITLTWGNVSALDREKGLIVIKPSGVAYDEMKAEDMVVCDLSGNVVEGDLRPSSDLPTHVELYRHFADIGGIVHTHSCYASAWAQAGEDIPALGTTHGDYFFGAIPCTREMHKEEIEGDYEKETGALIWKTFQERKLDPMQMPGVLVRSHGPFAWGKSADEAVKHALVLEELTHMAIQTMLVKGHAEHISDALLQKHFMRKHGVDAYYGQNR